MMTARPAVDISKLKFVSLPDDSILRDFDSGEREVDDHVAKSCEWHHKYRSRVFCAVSEEIPIAYGFYCLAISASDSKYLSEEIVQANDGRGFVPFIYINYLAVRRDYQNQKIGTVLLINALTRCEAVVRNVGIYGVALNALTPRAAALYDRYGFRQYSESKFPLMILPSQSLIELIAGTSKAGS
jgi:ribosomal protein S18 acetylase RimI-like enzyme